MNAQRLIPLAVTMGDPAGIGPEICADLLLEKLYPESVVPILIGDSTALNSAAGKTVQLETLRTEITRSDLRHGNPYFMDLDNTGGNLQPGLPTRESGSASAAYLDAAVKLIKAGLADGVVTAPISKEAWYLAGIDFPGHTEFFKSAAGVRRTEMIFIGGGFSVALFTTHRSLLSSIKALKRESLVDFISFVVSELDKYGMRGLRVAVAALNPHAGEAGMFGNEENLIISPAVEDCRAAGIDIHGPFPADSLFHPEARRKYDLVIALHHDQGLIPIKTVAFYSAVNVTLGLPFVRTSPGHGVAFDIARKGTACSDGLVSAMRTAADLLAKKADQK